MFYKQSLTQACNNFKKQTNKPKTKEIAKRIIQQLEKDKKKIIMKRKPQELKGCRENEDPRKLRLKT